MIFQSFDDIRVVQKSKQAKLYLKMKLYRTSSLLLKKFFYWKISCLEEAPVSKKNMLWKITYSGENLLRNSTCAEKAFIFKK